MRLSIPVLAGLAALLVPAATAAATTSTAASPVVLVADGPLVFSAPPAACPLGVATATVTVLGTGEQAVSTACARKVASCGAGCSRFKITYDVPLTGGEIRSNVMQRQQVGADGRTVGV